MTTQAFDERFREKVAEQVKEVVPSVLKGTLDPEGGQGPKASLHQEGVLAPITQMEVFGIPLGKAAVGGTTALLVSELVDAFVTRPPEGVPFTRVLVKGVAAFGLNQWLGGLMGRDAARLASIFIGFDLLRDLVPIDSWVRGLVTGISGRSTMSVSHSTSSSNSSSSSSHSSGSNGHHVDGMALLTGHLEGVK